MEKGKHGFAALGDLPGYRVAPGNPDIRGWEVVGADNAPLGRVDELIVDLDAYKAHYMVVRVDPAGLRLGNEACVLVPVRQARLVEEADRVVIDDVTPATVESLPAYDPTAFSAEHTHAAFGTHAEPHEHAERRFFGKRREEGASRAYVILNEEEVDVGKREVEVGEVVVRKRLEARHVEAEVQREVVDVETPPGVKKKEEPV